MTKRTVLALFLALSGAGVAVIALPDNGPRLAFSQTHGPGVLDAVGIVALLGGSAVLWGYLIKARPSLNAAPPRVRTMWTFGTGLGIGLLLASVFGDFAYWWAVGAGLLVLVQMAMFTAASGTAARSPHGSPESDPARQAPTHRETRDR